jgi:hypothetical protein
MADANAPDVYWSLYQAIVWALTRDPILVDEAAGQSKHAGFDVKVAMCQEKLKRAGRDINLELWKASGWPMLPAPGFGVTEVTDPKGVDSYSSQWPPWFHRTNEYLVALMRKGRINSRAKRPGEAEYSALSSADWNDLEISEKDGLTVAKSILPTTYGGYRFVQVPQTDVLREFPAEPPVADAAPEAEAAPTARRSSNREIKTLLLAAEEKEGRLTQKRALEIVPGNAPPGYPQAPRAAVRKVWGTLHPDAKPGRPKAQNN